MPCFFGLFLDPASHFCLCLVEKADDLAGNVLAAGLLLVHDAGRGGEDDVAELTGGKELDNPLLELVEADVVAGRDDTALVEAANTVSKGNSIRSFVPGTHRPLSWTTILPERWSSISSNSPICKACVRGNVATI